MLNAAGEPPPEPPCERISTLWGVYVRAAPPVPIAQGMETEGRAGTDLNSKRLWLPERGPPWMRQALCSNGSVSWESGGWFQSDDSVLSQTAEGECLLGEE